MTLINGLAPMIGLINFIGMGDLGYVLFNILILILTLIVFIAWIKRDFKSSLNRFRITKPKIKLEWIALGMIGISMIYIFFITLTNGTWVYNQNNNILQLVLVILITSLTTAITEEIFFRGFLLGYIEKKTNTYLGVIISAILFGIVHIMNGSYNIQNIALIVVGISIAGIFYSLLTTYYKTIWAVVVVHFLFDSTELFDITTNRSNKSVAEYVYHSPYQLVTGGEYGATVSIITIFSFVVLIACITFKMRKNPND